MHSLKKYFNRSLPLPEKKIPDILYCCHSFLLPIEFYFVISYDRAKVRKDCYYKSNSLPGKVLVLKLPDFVTFIFYILFRPIFSQTLSPKLPTKTPIFDQKVIPYQCSPSSLIVAPLMRWESKNIFAYLM